nr:PREDICTED: autophagy-related protein 2 isoform X2 [Musa acuminata subsp. malaccensis]
MFSGWDFSRSGAIKRVCKFLLKKKLGEVILGDIDLDQLDVQLSTGTIHLSDLALNVDFLNQKIAGAPIVVKEGSLKSLSIKIPWKLRNCEIEVDELELVLGPFSESNIPPTDADCSPLSHDGQQRISTKVDKIEPGPSQDSYSSIPVDVHEGVKTIAKIVKWILTSFHVRLKGIIVAFDPRSGLDESGGMFHRLLVFRIKEIEFGTCVSKDSMAKLMNFVKFQEANLEFLQMDDIDDGPELHSVTGRSFNKRCLGCGTIPVLSGVSGGFSGTLNLSIPWKNGSLDIHKVDADVSVDPMELRLEPSCIEWVIAMWQTLSTIGASSSWTHYHQAADSSNLNCRSHDRLSMSHTIYLDADGETSLKDSEFRSINSTITPERALDPLVMRNVIHNWVPEYVYQEDKSELEPDYGASIDQFFECFDGMRSSHAYSASSGIWNWTCSVFNAISVASNLASGMGDVPKEQHVETSLRAVIADISVILFLSDEQQYLHGSNKFIDPSTSELSSESYMSCLSSMNTNVSTVSEVNPVNRKMHYLAMRCQNVVLDLETYSQDTKFNASVKHIEVDAYHDTRNCDAGISSNNCKNDSNEQMFLSHYLQEKVQSSLPPFPFHIRYHASESAVEDNAVNGLVQVRLLESFGDCSCRFNVNSKTSNGVSMTLTSFVIDLPPFVLWVHFNLFIVLLDLFNRVESSLKENNVSENVQPNMQNKRNRISSPDVAETGISSSIATVSPRASFQGNIIIAQARIIICFPSEYYGDFRNSTLLDNLIILEHSLPLNTEETSGVLKVPKATSARDQSCAPSSSLHLSIKNFDIYMVKSSVENALDDQICNLGSQLFCAVKILSVKGLTHSGVTMLWQKGPVTGTWMADRAWSLASSRDQNSNKIIGKGSEFSVSSGENLEETSSNIRQELILSSAFLLHIKSSYVWINLDNHDYKFLVCLLNNVIDKCSRESNSMDTSTDMGMKNEQMSLRSSNISQTSILVECNAIDTCIRLNELVEVSRPLQKELQGSWSCFKLKIEKFELLSVSNIGGKEDAKLLWLNHGEGDLWGSICSSDEKACAVRHELPLITCRNSAMRRGNGEGANTLAFGPAGTVVTHIWNPQLHQSYTSIIVRCGTVIAPGGRLDWITAVCLFFSSPPRGKGNPEDDGKTQVSFLLDLVDVALSYEPQNKQFQVNSEVPGLDHNFYVELNKEKDEGYTACLLAAASLSLSVHTKSDPTTNYDIHMKDIGLLISESFGSITDIDGYCISYLQKARYSKVAQVSLLQAILRIRGMFWEIECEESHIDLESCRDTTSGLFRLIAQLQQLYAPDVEDALIHLQSRWDTVQQTDMDQNTSYLADPVSSNSVDLGSGLSTSNKECQAYGLLDDILENALECHPNSDHCGIQSHVSCEQCKVGDILNVNASRAGDAFAANYADSSCSSGVEAFQNQSDNEKSTPQVIESYYATDRLSSFPLCVGNNSHCEDNSCALDISFHRDTEYRRGGWYFGDCLTIVEDHISTILNQPDGKYLQQGELESDNSNSADCCLLKGRILLKNMDARWRMYSGVEWYKPEAVPTCSVNSNGRDVSLCLELSLVGLYIQYDIYPEGETNVSKLSLSVHDFNLYDRSKNAPWKMVLGNYHSKDHPRESCAKSLILNLEAVRPNPLTPLEDYRNHLMIPLLFHRIIWMSLICQRRAGGLEAK